MMEHFGKYPVISLSFKDIKTRFAKENLDMVKYIISHKYDDFKYVREILDMGKLKEKQIMHLQ